MEKLNGKLLDDLCLTKAMEDYANKEEEMSDLNDVLDLVLSNGVIDRDAYLQSIVKLTQLGYVESDLETEEDVEMSEATGFDVTGLSSAGKAYVEELMKDKKLGNKVKDFFVKADESLDKIANLGAVKIAGTIALPLLSLLV